MIKNFKLEESQIEILKIIALILMFFDHYSSIILNDNFHIFKIIGRIVFPLFSIILVYNYIYNTKNKFNYIKRLLIFGIFSQSIYYIGFKDYFLHWELNIFFTLSFGLGIIYLFEMYLKNKNFFYKILFFVFTLIYFMIFSKYISYGYLGVFLIPLIYFFLSDKKFIYLILMVIFIYLLNIGLGYYLTSVGVVSLLVVYFVSKIKNFKIKRLNKWFFYLFYPIHILIIKFLF